METLKAAARRGGWLAAGAFFSGAGNLYVANLTCLDLSTGRLHWQWHSPDYGVTSLFPVTTPNGTRIVAVIVPYDFVHNEQDVAIAVFDPAAARDDGKTPLWNPPLWIQQMPPRPEWNDPARPAFGCPATDGRTVWSWTAPVNAKPGVVNSTHATLLGHDIETGATHTVAMVVPGGGSVPPPFELNAPAPSQAVYTSDGSSQGWLTMLTYRGNATRLVGFPIAP